MAATEAQDRVADQIASGYDGQVRATPNTGPRADRLIVACPDGRTVVLAADGSTVADSAVMA